MKKFFCALTALFCLATPVISFSGCTPTETVSLRYETSSSPFEGFGTSLCWFANRIGYSDALSQKCADVFFGKDGLNLNIMRYNIGGGDDPTHRHITRTDSAMPGWMNENGVYDYTADRNQLNVLTRAVEAAGAEAKVELFSNSPPYFMTVSGCASGSTEDRKYKTNIKAGSFGDFAEYLAHVTDYMCNELNMPVVSLSPMNEPTVVNWHAYSVKQEGCNVEEGEDQSRLIEETYAALQRHSLTDKVALSACEESFTDRQLDEFYSLTDGARSCIGRVNTHSYKTEKIKKLGSVVRENNLNLWMSEVDGAETAGVGAGEMGAALWLGNKIIYDMNNLAPSAWVIWQIIGSHVSKDGFNGNKDSGAFDLNGGYWGAAIADHDRQEIILTQKYYAFGQFSKFIRPEAKIIRCSSETLAALNKDGSLAIVAVNARQNEKTKNFALSGLDRSFTSVQAVRTSGNSADGEKWAQITPPSLHGSSFTAALKPNSITTFILK